MVIRTGDGGNEFFQASELDYPTLWKALHYPPLRGARSYLALKKEIELKLSRNKEAEITIIDD